MQLRKINYVRNVSKAALTTEEHNQLCKLLDKIVEYKEEPIDTNKDKK